MKNGLLIILSFWLSIGFSQSKLTDRMESILLKKENELLSDKEYLNQLLSLLQESGKKATPESGRLLSEIGKAYYKTENNFQAIAYLKKAIAIQQLYKNTQLEALNKTRNNLAWIYSYEGNERARYAILKQIIADKGKDKYTFNAGIDCSILEARKGDFYTALNRLTVALAEAQSVAESIRIRSTIISIYGKMYENVFVPKKTTHLQIIKKHQHYIENQFDSAELDEAVLYATYNNLANVYEAFGYDNQALQLYLKVKHYYHKQEDHEQYYSVLNNIGYLYSKQNRPVEALQCYNEVIQSANDPKQMATAYDNMGYFMPNASSEKRIAYFEKAIQTMIQQHATSFRLPSLEEIRNSGHEQDVLVFMVDLASHYLNAYKESKKKPYLIEAKKALYRIDELVSLIRYESNSELSKLFWIEKGVNSYLLAVEVCYLLQQPYEAFYFMEKNKALLLQENIKTLQAKLELAVPQSIQKREYQLHYELLSLEKQFQQHTASQTLRTQYINKSKELNLFMDSLSLKYPQYTRIKKGISIVRLQKEISKLKSNECLVSYILDETRGYGIFSTSKQLYFFPLSNVPQLQKNIQLVKQWIKQPILSTAEKKQYQKTAHTVFTSLFPFKEAGALIKNKKLTIVPDHSLLNLPFEVLTLHDSGLLSKNYLIHQTEVTYLQSFSVFDGIQYAQKEAQRNLLFINPTTFDHSNLPDLRVSEALLQSLNQYRKTDIVTGKQAVKKQFYNSCSNYRIIHLNTHAGVDQKSETPWILFQDAPLTLPELYGLQNHAELVILDACKTNEGVLADGEGLINLSRGFFYNGSKSVVASLWNVNEKAGNEIIATFYQELSNGKSKSKALQLAKLKYLQEHQLSELLPYYWASFTLTGSTTPIHISDSWFDGKRLLLLAAVLVVFFLLYYSKYFQKK